MRELLFKDVYSMSKILKKLDIKIDTDGKTQEQTGAEIIVKLGENLYLAENEVNEFMGSLIGITGDEFGNLTISESLKHFEEFKKLPGVNSFLSQVGQLMK